MTKRARGVTEVSRRRRVLSTIGWYVVPSLIAALGLSYFALALAWHVNPPVLAVQGTSMQPTLRTGDLVFLRHANISQLKKGDVIALKVPLLDQHSYGLPASVVHRIISVRRATGGEVFVTKGDHNAGPDLFNTQPNAVIGQVQGVVPYAGYALLFVESRDGRIFLGALVVIAILYLIAGVFEERRLNAQGTALAVQAILSETERIERLVTGQSPGAPPRSAPELSANWPPVPDVLAEGPWSEPVLAPAPTTSDVVAPLEDVAPAIPEAPSRSTPHELLSVAPDLTSQVARPSNVNEIISVATSSSPSPAKDVPAGHAEPSLLLGHDVTKPKKKNKKKKKKKKSKK